MGRRAPTRNGKTAAQKRTASSRTKDESFSRASSSSSVILYDDEDTYVPKPKRSFTTTGNSYNNSYGESPREDKYPDTTRRTTGRDRSSVNYAALNSPPRAESHDAYDNDDSVADVTPNSKASYSHDYTDTTPRTTSDGNGYSYSEKYASSASKSKPGPATVKLTSASYASKNAGPQAEVVIGTGNINGELHLLIKWKDSEEADMIPAKVARYKYPSVVIPFYEQKFRQQLKEKEASQPSFAGRKSFP